MVFSLLTQPPPLPLQVNYTERDWISLARTWSEIFIKTVHLNPRVYLKAAHRVSGAFNIGNVHSRLKTCKISQENSEKVVGFSMILVSLMLKTDTKQSEKSSFFLKLTSLTPQLFFLFPFRMAEGARDGRASSTNWKLSPKGSPESHDLFEF